MISLNAHLNRIRFFVGEVAVAIAGDTLRGEQPILPKGGWLVH